MREYHQRPEVKEHKREYNRATKAAELHLSLQNVLAQLKAKLEASDD
jgi:hypothetical protein